MAPTNPPAFPFPHYLAPNGETMYGEPGMSLRDHFAGLALQALIAKLPPFDRKGEFGPIPADIHEIRLQIAQSAFDYADAMLAKREGQ